MVFCPVCLLKTSFVSNSFPPLSNDQCTLLNQTNYSAAFPHHLETSPRLRPFCTRLHSPPPKLSSTFLLVRDSSLYQLCLKCQGGDVTYLRMTLIRPEEAWLSSKEKSRSSLLSFFFSSLKSRSEPLCQTLDAPLSLLREKTL